MPKDHGIGASSKRREDIRFLTGDGQYTDDINRPGQLHAHFVRSEMAHGTIARLDTEEAKGMPGVVAIFTATDLEGAGGVPCGWQVTDRNGEPMKEPKHPILAEGKVRHVGDPVAVVIAESPSRPATRPRRSTSRSTPCPPSWTCGRRSPPTPSCMTTCRAISASTGASSRRTRRPWTRPSPRPTTSRSSSSSTTASSPTRWSPARPSASMTARATSTPSTRPARTRMSSAC